MPTTVDGLFFSIHKFVFFPHFMSGHDNQMHWLKLCNYHMIWKWVDKSCIKLNYIFMIKQANAHVSEKYEEKLEEKKRVLFIFHSLIAYICV